MGQQFFEVYQFRDDRDRADLLDGSRAARAQ
jgi:hypothetical protein